MKYLTITALLALSLLWTYPSLSAQGRAPVNNRFERIPENNNDTLRFQIGSCAMWIKGMSPKRLRIFRTMANDPADFTIWMGDHVYFLNPKHWGSHRGMSDRYREVRSKIPYLQTLLDIRPQYAIWDDHEYGPNNANGTWLLKDTSLSVFKTMWANPSYGLPDVPGVFFHVHHADAEFFFTDGRYHCYPWKQMFGPQQMEWLKSALSASDARFKFVVCGSQVISNSATTENLRRYPDEYRELMEFIGEHAIEGVVFLSGDRHFSEISLLERPGKYPLYDLTCSALTSFYFPHGKYNDFQVKGSFTSRSCYGRITLMGSNEDRRCRMEWIDRKGKVLRTWEIRADQLR